MVARALWAEAQQAWAQVNVGLHSVAMPGIGHVDIVPELNDENFALVRDGLVSARPRGVEIERPIEVIQG